MKVSTLKSFIPRKLTRLIQLMYGNKCRNHPTETLTRSHLLEAHNNTIDPIGMILHCNGKDSMMCKNRIKQAII